MQALLQDSRTQYWKDKDQVDGRKSNWAEKDVEEAHPLAKMVPRGGMVFYSQVRYFK
jgi:hypothetical protein